MTKRLARLGFACLVMAVIPAAANLLVWKIGVVPARANLAAVHETASLAELKPRLEALVSESDRLLVKQSRETPPTEDIASALQWVQGLARAQGVKIEEINKKEPEGGSAGLTPVDLKVTGDYFKLTRWLGALEKDPNIRMDRCLLRPSSAPGADNQMDITLQVLSKNP